MALDVRKPPVSFQIFGASGPNHSPGLVPDPGSVAGSARFLREDATFVTAGVVRLAVLGDPTGAAFSVPSLSFDDFTPVYSQYLLIFNTVCPDTNSVNTELMQIDGGSVQTAGYANSLGGASTYIDPMNGIVVLSSAGASAGFGISGYALLNGANMGGGAVKIWGGQMNAPVNTPPAITRTIFSGFRVQNQPISGFQFQFSAGHIVQGAIAVYGIP